MISSIFYKQISKKVKYLRQSKNISQLEIALNIGFKTDAFYNRCENNTDDKHFNLEHLYKIAKFLNVEIDYFFN